MHGLKEMLLKEQKYLESVIAKASEHGNSVNSKAREQGDCGSSKASEHGDDVPEGRLRISVNQGNVRYYHCVDAGRYDYIPKDNIQLAQRLAQKNYNDKVIMKATARARLISKCLKGYNDDEIEQLYDKLHPERKSLITPVNPTTRQLEEEWYSAPYTGKAFLSDSSVILTEKGERVRSKSEKILADYFYRNNILYKYEKPLNLIGYGIVYPDFTFFSKKLRKEVYWEHEGMMDKAEYAQSAVKKINSYQLNGIYPGDRLILTFETEQDVLNSRIVAKLVQMYLF